MTSSSLRIEDMVKYDRRRVTERKYRTSSHQREDMKRNKSKKRKSKKGARRQERTRLTPECQDLLKAFRIGFPEDGQQQREQLLQLLRQGYEAVRHDGCQRAAFIIEVIHRCPPLLDYQPGFEWIARAYRMMFHALWTSNTVGSPKRALRERLKEESDDHAKALLQKQIDASIDARTYWEAEDIVRKRLQGRGGQKYFHSDLRLANAVMATEGQTKDRTDAVERVAAAHKDKNDPDKEKDRGYTFHSLKRAKEVGWVQMKDIADNSQEITEIVSTGQVHPGTDSCNVEFSKTEELSVEALAKQMEERDERAAGNRLDKASH